MPELEFVLPHWLYWSGLVIFPLVALFIFRSSAKKEAKKVLSLPLAYFMLLVGGFIGIHRLYLKSRWAIIFIALFATTLMLNIEVRQARDEISGTKNSIRLAEFKLVRAEKALKNNRRGAEQKIEQAQAQLAQAKTEFSASEENSAYWDIVVNIIGGAILFLLLVDALLLPKLVQQREALERGPPEEGFHCPSTEAEYDDRLEPFVFTRIISRINGLAGEFVAYWSVIAVFVYYYEVIARYVFNSPTNWAHEGMFLMFGMQYLLAGGFVLRENAHVRVDVLYLHLSNRGKAIVDLFTSIFFFIFMFTLLLTGWIFFHDSYEVQEVSFTEWGIQYWPIKFALPLGAVMLLLQGLAQLIKDVAIVFNPAVAEITAEPRPEG
jgi:TRAP-type mannitol/chloroaromatic compound transport system permease small subunit